MKRKIEKVIFFLFPYMLLSTQYLITGINEYRARTYELGAVILFSFMLYIVIGFMFAYFINLMQRMNKDTKRTLEVINLIVLLLFLANFYLFGIHLPLNPIIYFMVYDYATLLAMMYIGIVIYDLVRK